MEPAKQISMTQTQAAKALGVSRQTLAAWEKCGLIKGHVISRIRLYLVADLEKLAATGKAA